ncbi:hypothetical protein V8G54_006636 [Vigna mungo]|uniref:Uncharacterized protein n=1 Tax=Vigna mungo TaxID=3915 RepID=A0AAQ3S4R3_VIGMU
MVYAWLHPVCLFGRNGREKGETETETEREKRELHCTARVRVSSTKGGKRGWIYKGRVSSRYLFERKGIRVIACWRRRRTRTGAREAKQRVILLRDTHCSKKQNQKNGSQALPLSHWGFVSLSHSLRI